MAEQRTPDVERAKFEAVVRHVTHANDESFRRDPDFPDDYLDHMMSMYWLLWQAARRAPPALDAEELPSWIDNLKGQDPLMDDIIGYIIDLRAQIASERQAKEYEQRHAAESEVALAKVHAQLARQSAPEGAPVGMEAVAWLEAEASARGRTARQVLNSFVYSTRMHTKAAPVTSNPVWALYAPTSASAKPADQPAPGPWQVLGMEDMPDADRKLDVILTNGVLEQNRDHSQIDWTQVADWRYAADQNKMENNDE